MELRAPGRDVERARVGAQLTSRSLDAVIDTIGGDALESSCKALRPNGIIVSVVRAGDEAYVRSKRMRAVLHYPGTSSRGQAPAPKHTRPVGRLYLRLPRNRSF